MQTWLTEVVEHQRRGIGNTPGNSEALGNRLTRDHDGTDAASWALQMKREPIGIGSDFGEQQ